MVFRNVILLRPLIEQTRQQQEKATIATTYATRENARTDMNKGGDDRQQRSGRMHEIQSNDRLIASDCVEGTTVYDTDGNKLGTVRKMMIEKRSGTVRHVILGYGGLFGMGEENYPLPWDALEYDEDRDGYVSRIDNDRMRGKDAPRYGKNDEPDWNENYQRQVWLYYFPA